MSFYGSRHAPDTVRKMYERFLKCWSADTCAPRMRADWTPDNPTLGQCSITSFIVQDELGGEVYGIPLENGGYHCFNVVDGFRFDLTSEQFCGAALNYDKCVLQFRGSHFFDHDKYSRYLQLKERFDRTK